MKKFVLNLIKFLIITTVILNCFIFIGEKSNYFICGIKDKHKLLKNTESPRIILVGGSGVGHSIDSKFISEQTGYNIINMGLFAQFGFRYMLEEIKNDIRKDDIIILIPEYHHFYYFFEGWRGLNELLYVYPRSVTFLTSKDQLKVMAKSFPRFIIGKTRGLNLNKFKFYDKNPLYNKYGDYIAHLDGKKKYQVNTLGLFDDFIDTSKMKINTDAIPTINQFAKEMSDKGAYVYFLYPTIPQKQYYENQSKIKALELKLNQFADFTILNKPVNEVQPISDFYNTVYHLNRKGRNIRTIRLVSHIKSTPAFKCNSPN